MSKPLMVYFAYERHNHMTCALTSMRGDPEFDARRTYGHENVYKAVPTICIQLPWVHHKLLTILISMWLRYRESDAIH